MGSVMDGGSGSRIAQVTSPPNVAMDREQLDRFITAFNADDRRALTAEALRQLDDAHVAMQATIWLTSEVILGSANAVQWLATLLTQSRDGGEAHEKAAVARRARAERWRSNVEAILATPKPSVQFLPPNLKGICGGWLPQYLRIVEEGIPLYGIPGAKVAEDLLRPQSASERRELLDAHAATIASDCRDALQAMDSIRYQGAIHMTTKAIDTLACGHAEAAQTLAATVLDSLKARIEELAKEFTYERIVPTGRSPEPTAFKELPMRLHLGFGPIWCAFRQFWPLKGDSIPTEFSRHATAHTIDSDQFTAANAVQGVMIVTSLLYLLTELELEKMDSGLVGNNE